MNKAVLFAALLAVIAGSLGTAWAEDAKPAADDEAARICAVFGEDYVLMPGTSTCVKIGGFVRFDTKVTERTHDASPATAPDIKLHFDK
jgi:hypothetical protein